jgi:hypothetical protein
MVVLVIDDYPSTLITKTPFMDNLVYSENLLLFVWCYFKLLIPQLIIYFIKLFLFNLIIFKDIISQWVWQMTVTDLSRIQSVMCLPRLYLVNYVSLPVVICKRLIDMIVTQHCYCHITRSETQLLNCFPHIFIISFMSLSSHINIFSVSFHRLCCDLHITVLTVNTALLFTSSSLKK